MVVGVDTVRLSQRLTTPPKGLFSCLKKSKSSQLSFGQRNKSLGIFLTYNNNGWFLSLEASLPKILNGTNYDPLQFSLVLDGVQRLIDLACLQVPTLEEIDFADAKIVRLDLAWNSAVAYNKSIPHAILKSYVGTRGLPGVIYHGPKFDTFYTKQVLRGQRIRYQSAIAYPKIRSRSDNSPQIRLELRLHSGWINGRLDQPLLARELENIAPFLLEHFRMFWMSRLEFLNPVADRPLVLQMASDANVDQSHVDDLIELLQTNSMEDVIKLLAVHNLSRRAIVETFRRFQLGHGNPVRHELLTFVDVFRSNFATRPSPY